MRLFAALFAAIISITTLAPAALASPPKSDPLRLVEYRTYLAEGKAGVSKSGDAISSHRYANLRRGQSIDFWATGQGGDFTLRVLAPGGTFYFDAERVNDPDAPKNAIVRGFHFKAPEKGRYMIQFIAKASSKVAIVSDGWLSKPEPVTLPGTWSIDHEAMAFDMLNNSNGDMAELASVTKRLKRAMQVDITFKADGTWTAKLTRPGQTQTNSGTWSRRGETVTTVTLTQNKKPIEKQERVTVRIEDGQLVTPGNGFNIYMDKVS